MRGEREEKREGGKLRTLAQVKMNDEKAKVKVM